MLTRPRIGFSLSTIVNPSIKSMESNDKRHHSSTMLLFIVFAFGLLITTTVGDSSIGSAHTVRHNSQHHHRSHQQIARRSISLSNWPGDASAAQIIPADAVQFALSRQNCQSKTITQNVSASGCESQSIRNRMCFGVCATLHMPSVPGVDRLEMCTKCQPAGKRRIQYVILQCQGGTTRNLSVPVVDRCACSPCETYVG